MINSEYQLSQAMRHIGEYETVLALAEVDLIPATDIQVGNVLAAMWSDYFPNVDQTSEGEVSKMDRWLTALTKYPADLVQMAYMHWFENDRRGFAPRSPGQLMASVGVIFHRRQLIRSRAIAVPEILARVKAEATDPAEIITPAQAEEIDRLHKVKRAQEAMAPESPIPGKPKPRGTKARDAQLDKRNREILEELKNG